MSLDRDQTWERLSALWESRSILSLESKGEKYAILSDIHLGDGGEADDFYRNERALLTALDYYRHEGYSLILLGDIEELWQFDLEAIVRIYQNSIYPKIQAFGDDRVYRVFGNHDQEWGGLVDPTKVNGQSFKLAEEALKIKDEDGADRLLLVHGHQGSVECDKYAWFSRFFARIFTRIEPLATSLGLYPKTSAPKSQIAQDYERTYYQWAKSENVIVICGHTHRAIFGSKSRADLLRAEIAELKIENAARDLSKAKRRKNLRKIDQLEDEWEDERRKGRVIEPTDPDRDPLPCYFNTGCGLYTDGLTALEIADDEIRLVKWNKDDKKTKKREVFDQGDLEKIIKQVTKK